MLKYIEMNFWYKELFIISDMKILETFDHEYKKNMKYISVFQINVSKYYNYS